jgi:uncharacterized protein (DUF1501 family)
MYRRMFLKGGAVAMFGTGAAPLWLARAAGAGTGGRRKVLVTVFQRGASDGLNVVAPHGDPAYYALRPTLALPRPELLDLDGYFGLHPALAPLKPVWDAGKLAIVHASGSPDPTRSHFDAQDYMESGTPGRKSTADGWLNRALAGTPKSPVRAVALGTTLPRALRGSQPAVAIAGIPEFRLRNGDTADAFAEMYGRDARLSPTARETFDAMKLLRSLPDSSRSSRAAYPSGQLGDGLRQIAQLIKSDVGLEVAFADMRGWDTHVNQTFQLRNLLTTWSAALAAFWNDLGDRVEDVVLVSLSEFGRTARENGNRGTDHGHANAMFVLGGPVKGGKVYGDWPGLAAEQLYEGRDLAVTTDFRDILGEIVTRHLGVRDTARVFPGHPVAPRGLLG